MLENLTLPEKRNVVLDGKRTTLQLERYVWLNVEKVAQATSRTYDALLNDIWNHKGDMAMAPAVRLFLMLYFTDYAESNTPVGTYTASEDHTAFHAAEQSTTKAYLSYHHATRQLYEITE